MPNFPAIATLGARLFAGRQNETIPRTAVLFATALALALAITPAWRAPAHADGGSPPARSQSAAPAPDGSGAAAQAHVQQILRALSDRHINNWVRYWQTRARCDAPPTPVKPLDRVLLTLTVPLCAQLEARLGVNPADHPPRGEDSSVGLLINEPGAAMGYTLFIVADTLKIYLIDPLGRIAREWDLEDTLQDTLPKANIRYAVELLDNGNLLATLRRRVLEIDPRGNVVWQYELRGAHHDFLKMPNGNFLLLAETRKTREEAIAAGANPELVPGGITHDYLIEVRPDYPTGGEIVWQWSVWDHLVQDFDPTKPNYGAIDEHPELININFPPISVTDRAHINSVDYNPELDQIMLSPRHFSELWIIDRSTTTEEARGHSGGNGGMGGDLLYRWGNPRAYDRGDASDQRLFWQHQTHWIPPGLPGAGNILLFNNGFEFPGYRRYYSSIDELALPADGYRYRLPADSSYPPLELIWTYVAQPPEDFYEVFMSGTQRLPNGNTLIANRDASSIFQVTPNGKIAWKYNIPRHYHISLRQDEAIPAQPAFGRPDASRLERTVKNKIYRAYWYPPDYAGLQALDLAPGAYIESDQDLLDWAIAAIAAGHFGEPLARSRFDIYIYENIIIYFKQPCDVNDVSADGARARFFLRVYPADARDLPAFKREDGFENLTFNHSATQIQASDDWCAALQTLPLYPIKRVAAGQFNSSGTIWRVDIDLNE